MGNRFRGHVCRSMSYSLLCYYPVVGNDLGTVFLQVLGTNVFSSLVKLDTI